MSPTPPINQGPVVGTLMYCDPLAFFLLQPLVRLFVYAHRTIKPSSHQTIVLLLHRRF